MIGKLVTIIGSWSVCPLVNEVFIYVLILKLSPHFSTVLYTHTYVVHANIHTNIHTDDFQTHTRANICQLIPTALETVDHYVLPSSC